MCEYCEQGDYELFVFYDEEKASSVVLCTGERPAIVSGEAGCKVGDPLLVREFERYDIDYCPWCGRRLTKEEDM